MQTTRTRMSALLALLLLTPVFLVHAQEAEPEGEETLISRSVDAGRGVARATADTTKGALKGVGEATTEVAGAVKSGSVQVAQQGRKVWQDAVLPAFQRTAAAIPGVLKAVLLLVAFWIVASVVGAVVAKLLNLTRVDDRAAKDWGLEKMLVGPQGQRRSLAALVGKVVKWIIILFGFVAFFNALNLGMVAGPLQNIVDKIVGVIPNLLKAFVILFVYWAIAALVRMGVTKGLTAANFDEKAGKFFPPREMKGEMVGASGMIGRLLFYVILLFGIPPFLEALGQQALVAPLQAMLEKTLAFLPNIIAAVIIFFIGKIVATIVREVVTSFLAAAGADAGAEKVGLGKVLGAKKLSEVVGMIVYFFIIVPIVVSAVDSLQIRAISDPVKSTLEKVLAAVPALLVAVIIVAVGYAIARLVKGLVESFLSGVGFDQIPGKIGLGFLKPKEGGASLSAIGGTVVMIIILLLTAQQALASLGLVQLAAFADWVVDYLPQLFVGLVILLAALSLGQYVGKLAGDAAAGSGHGKLIGGVAKYAVIFLGVSMALDQLGVGEQIVTAAVTMILGGAALALGLAFGLGGQDKARRMIEGKKDT